MEAMKELKDLVPPRELCEQASGIVGNGTAMVWVFIGGCDPKGRVYLREQIDVAKAFPLGISSICPAPTLAEIRVHLRNLSIFMADGKWIVQCQVNPEDFESEAAEDESGIEAAALRLLMRVKGVTQ